MLIIIIFLLLVIGCLVYSTIYLVDEVRAQDRKINRMIPHLSDTYFSRENINEHVC